MTIEFYHIGSSESICIFKNICLILLWNTVDQVLNYICIWKEQLFICWESVCWISGQSEFFSCFVWSCGFEVGVDGILLISEFLGSCPEVKPLEKKERRGQELSKCDWNIWVSYELQLPWGCWVCVCRRLT